jgi:CHAT domain-containing protein/Tfp pilus assembly protein PilF
LGVLAPLSGDYLLGAEASFSQIVFLFERGELEASQGLAANSARRFQRGNPEWAARFRVLEAESAAWRGMNQEVVRILADEYQAVSNPGIDIERMALLGLAQAHLHQFDEAGQAFAQAQNACNSAIVKECGELVRARAGMAVELGQYKEAHRLFAESLVAARKFGQRWDESAALMNLGGICLREERLDEAIDWLRDAERIAFELNAGDIAVNTLGNLGWAYYRIGDSEKALDTFNYAVRRSVILGDIDDAITWLTISGHIYQESSNPLRAAKSYRQALDMARKIGDKEGIVNSLEELTHASIEDGHLDEASTYIDQTSPLIHAESDRLDELDVTLSQGKIALARRQDKTAEELFRTVERDQASLTYMRLDAEHQIAKLFELEGRNGEADEMYRTALETFESSRRQLKEETSELPFLANATPIYDDYIHFLVKQGKPEEALATADQSRARTLAEDLGVAAGKAAFRPVTLDPRRVAQKTGATLFFYWLGAQQSYLWVVTPVKIELFSLPRKPEIDARVERYRRALLDFEDPLSSANEDGQALYNLLVAPAAKGLSTGAPVMILADGALSQLNFETLLVPGRGSEHAPNAAAKLISSQAPGAHPGPDLHYWIDDATLLSAPSLAMLAAAKPVHNADRNLLLLGNPVSPNKDFPALPLFGTEMTQVERHFEAHHATVFAGQKASPSAYLDSDPAQYAYIHFVAHAFASRADPLDSAIILSGSPAGEDSFKLYARDIMRRPIDAQLVTISACNGIGARSYAGEGLVGLSWAFLRAGAHSVIGALWEAIDDSTPRLMDSLYQGVEDGHTPAVALRAAKLSLLHSQTKFRRPFYWAPFQIYTRQ